LALVELAVQQAQLQVAIQFSQQLQASVEEKAITFHHCQLEDLVEVQTIHLHSGLELELLDKVMPVVLEH
jgi:hypothetical protein